jgi:hypothetical protein
MDMNEEQKEALFANDEILSALKERWFKLAKQEKYPKTKDITKKLDDLEKSISNRKKELLHE